MKDENRYAQARIQKVKELREKGINPYPSGLKPQNTVSELFKSYEALSLEELEKSDQHFSIAGRVVAVRSFGKAGFLKLRDRTGEMQVFFQKDNLSEAQFILYKETDIGDFLMVKGPLFRTKTNEFTLKAKEVTLTTKTIQPLPEKWHGLTDVEVRYRQRYIDLIANPEVRKIFEMRSHIVSKIRSFLEARDFLEVETPMMHPIPGGAIAKPFITHHNTLDMDLYLRIAPELYLKRLVVGGFERVFEMNRNFRNEGISTQHNPEFTMLEFYQSYATYEDLMKLTEEMLSDVSKAVCGSEKISYQGVEIDFSPPFKKLSMANALIEMAGFSSHQVQDEKFLSSECLKRKLIDEKHTYGLGYYQTLLFEELVEKKLIAPTFITEFPTEVSPLARKNDHDASLVDRFELFIFGREIANGFSELNDPQDQKERFLKQVLEREGGNEEAMYFDADYITALEYGMPPTAGEGIGIDRLVMILTNQASIRDVILFPQLRSNK